MQKFCLTILLNILIFSALSQTVDFTFINSNGSNGYCSPSTINFTPVCTGNPIGFSWYFGNGQTSNSAIPSITYTTGSYTVKLVALFQNQALEITKTIVVNPSITAGLSANKNYICKPDSINFNCTTNAASPSFLFNFGDGTNSVTTNNSGITHYYPAYGNFVAGVKVTSINGCVDTASYTITVKKPVINASVTPNTGGCVPITANFLSSVIIPPTSTVLNYAWNFGDGSAIFNSTTSNTSHPFLDSGTYNPSLVITTVEGCTDTLNLQQIKFGKPPTLITAYPKQLVYCANETAIFIAKANFANEYKWDFGDGTGFGYSSDTSISHRYYSLGPKIVKVIPIYNGCPGLPLSFTINIIGVIANFNYTNTCSAKKTFSFTNFSVGTQNVYSWSFGDLSPVSAVPNPTHTFPPVGIFNTRLTVVDNISGCRDSMEVPIFTANPTLVNTDTFLCRNATTTFTLLNNYSNPYVENTWSTVGLQTYPPPSTNSLTINASLLGNFTTHMVSISNGGGYCKDTVKLNKLISVRGPVLSYNTSTSACTNNNFIINNTSIPFATTDTINSWKWTFGIGNLVDNAYQPAPFIFPLEGTYTIRLVAKDKKGCADTLDKQILVKESPFLRIFPRSDVICQGKTIQLTAYHTDTLLWTPSSLVSCNTCDTTIATPITTTTIYAMASNAVGCSLKDSITITVFTPFTAPTNANTFFACLNDTVKITGVLPLNKKITWSPSFGLSNVNSYNPIATVYGDTTYTALLTDSLNCYSSTTIVKVKPFPLATVNAGPDKILAYNSPFTITPTYGAGVNSYLWTPIGNLDCTTCPNPSGLADKSQTFIINVATPNNCKAKDTISVFVECAYANLYMASAFNPSNSNVNKYYYPQTRGIKKINKFIIYNRFGQMVYGLQNKSPNVQSLGWDGKYKGILQNPAGFVYFLEATCELGEVITKNGTFLLIR
jgi:PKD repeat protein